MSYTRYILLNESSDGEKNEFLKLYFNYNGLEDGIADVTRHSPHFYGCDTLSLMKK